MSIKQMLMVWEREIGDGKYQQILLAMADKADEEGGSLYPSLDYLAWMTELHKNTVRRKINALIKMGVLEVIEEATPRRSAQYQLHLNKLPYKM